MVINNGAEKEFADWGSFQRALNSLNAEKKRLDQGRDPAPALHAWLDFVRRREQQTAFLLPDGDPHAFERSPGRLYLLPDVLAQEAGERWVLCQFEADGEKPAAIQILSWFTQEKARKRLTPVTELLPLDQFETSLTQVLRQRANEVLVENRGERHKRFGVALIWAEGELDIEFRGREYTHMDWVAAKGKVNRQEVLWERVSSAHMPPIIGVQIRSEEDADWPDDLLYRPKDGEHPWHPDFQFGHIAHADSFAASSDRWVYLSTNRARIYCVDLKAGRYWPSPMLGGVAHDVIAVRTSDGRRFLLCPSDHGVIYALDPVDVDEEGKTSLAADQELRIAYAQQFGVRIVRLVGYGADLVLALDEERNLRPMRISDPHQDAVARHELRTVLAQIYLDTPAPPAIKFEDRQRLALETWLAGFWVDIPQHRWLNHLSKRDGYANLSPAEARDLAEGHLRLLRRLWRWMQGTAAMRRQKEFTFAEDPVQLEPIWMLSELPDDAPDDLWLQLFRHHAQMRLWGEGLPEALREGYYARWEVLRQRIAAKRRQFGKRSGELRPLHIQASHALGSQVRHVRALDSECKRVVAVEYKVGIRVIKIPAYGDAEGAFEVSDTIEYPIRNGIAVDASRATSTHEATWEGVPHSLVAGPRLVEALAWDKSGQQGDPLLVLTDRGEVALYSVENTRSRLLHFERVSPATELRTATPFKIASTRGLWVGGRDPNRRAVLCWMTLWCDSNGWRMTFERRWVADQRGGMIRMLALSQERGQGNDTARYLWTVDSDEGMLSRWRIDVGKGIGGPELLPRSLEVVLRRQPRLHALATDGYADPQVMVSGGRDGLAMFWDLRYRTITRALGCGRRLNRVTFIRTKNKEKGYWILGSEHEDVQFVDDAGERAGLLQHHGPISAMCRLKCEGASERVLLGTSDGRLLIVGDNHALGEIPAAHDANEHFALYPLSQNAPQQALKYAELIRDCEEVLTRVAVAQAIVSYQGVRAALEQLGKVLEVLSVSHMGALLSLEEFGNFWHEARREQAVKLVEQLARSWQKLGELQGDVPMCRMVTSLIALLVKREWAPTHGKFDQLAHELLAQVVRCLWTSEDCAIAMSRPERLQTLRVGQAARHLPDLGDGAVSSDRSDEAARIHLWLLTLRFHWRLAVASGGQETLTLEALRKHTHNLMVMDVPFFDAAWQSLLRALCRQPVGAPSAPPKPLQPLFGNSLTPIKKPMLDMLIELWPQVAEWRRWLEDWQEALDALVGKSDVNKPSYAAWAERAALRALKDEVSTGESIFDVDGPSPFIALLWTPLSAHWNRLIDTRLAALDDMADKVRLVRVEPVYRWPTNTRVTVELQMDNRTARDLYIFGWELKDAEDGQPVSTSEADSGVLQSVPASDRNTVLELEFVSPEANRFQGHLELDLRDDVSQESLKVPVDLQDDRSIGQFDPDPRWQTTWQRLESLLEAAEPFDWVWGSYWFPDRRNELLHLIGDLYPEARFDVVAQVANDIRTSDRQLFCPDLPLGGDDRSELVGAMHGLLHGEASRGFSYLALAIWHWARGPMPESIQTALGTLVPQAAEVLAWLERLIPDDSDRATLKSGLQSLNGALLGVWCTYGEEISDESASLPPSAGLLGGACWQRLIKPRLIQDRALQKWLGEAPGQRPLLSRVKTLFDKTKYQDRANALGVGSGLLGNGVTRSGPWWTLLQPVTIQDRDFAAVRWHPDGNIADIAEELPPRLLLIGPLPDGKAPDWRPFREQKDVVVNLSSDRLLQLAFSGSKERSEALLSRWAALPYRFASPFREEGGMTTDGLRRHFIGREEEKLKLNSMLQNADRGDAAAALIVGMRRIGKTSLRQSLTLQESEHKRVIAMANGELLTHGSSEADFERWLYETIGLAWTEQGHPWRSSWSLERLRDQQTQARDEFQSMLHTIRRTTGKAPLLVLDETDQMMTADAPNFRVFSYLRGLAHDGRLALVATTYPHGAGRSDSLWRLNRMESTPLVNIFDTVLNLKPWSEENCWGFLKPSLATLGITLPQRFYSRLIRLTHRIPSLVHMVGNLIYGYPWPSERRIVDERCWHTVREGVQMELYTRFKGTIEQVAEKLDQSYRLQTGSQPTPSQALAGHRLYRALLMLARARVDAPDQPFRLRELAEACDPPARPERIASALNEMTHTLVIAGDLNDAERFTFALGLLPSLVHYIDQQENIEYYR